MSATDRIEKFIDLAAPLSRVWRALTDHEEFGTWFRLKLDGPFVVGQEATGYVTYPGYRHLRFLAFVKAIEPERYFAYTWTPYPADTTRDYSKETPTLVEFMLEATPQGSRLRVRESGFDKLPADRRAEAFRMNTNGWGVQMENIRNHVEAAS